MKLDCDVIVVGAGCAGHSAARDFQMLQIKQYYEIGNSVYHYTKVD